MKTTDFITTYNENAEYDDEAGSVKNNLHTIIRVSTHLERAIGDDENMAEWCQEKIAQVKGMIVSVMDYIISQHEMGKKDELPGFNAAAADVQMSEMLDFGNSEPSPVTSAITRRIMMQRVDLLQKYGPELVGNAIDEVADFVGDVEEIGSSDVSGWVRHVERMLSENPPAAFGVAEGIESFSSDELFNKVRKASRKAIEQTGDQSISSITVAVRSVLPSSSVTKKITSPGSLEALDSALRDEGIDFDELLSFLDSQSQYWGREGMAEGSTGSFIITARTAEGRTKKFRVKAATERAAVEQFTLHHNQAEIVKVTPEAQPFGSADNWLKDLKIREDATGGASSSSSIGAVVKELGEEGMTRKQVNKKLGGYTNITTKPKAVKVKGAY